MRRGRGTNLRQSIKLSTSILCVGSKRNFGRAYVSMEQRELRPWNETGSRLREPVTRRLYCRAVAEPSDVEG